jgi:hypothetical protein
MLVLWNMEFSDIDIVVSFTCANNWFLTWKWFAVKIIFFFNVNCWVLALKGNENQRWIMIYYNAISQHRNATLNENKLVNL